MSVLLRLKIRVTSKVDVDIVAVKKRVTSGRFFLGFLQK